MSALFNKDNAPLLGVALLRVSPLILSSASLMFSWAQNIFLRAFLHPSLRDDPAHPSGMMLPRYMPVFLQPGLWGIALTYIPATITCTLNGLMSNQSPEVRRLYLAGAMFSTAHFLWGPTMLALLNRISDPKKPGVANEEALAVWLPNHHTRTTFADIPAFLCILAATVASLAEGLM